MERSCIICGAAFKRKDSARLTCSQKCQQDQTKITQRKAYIRRKLQEAITESERKRLTKMLSMKSGYVCANCDIAFEKSSCVKTSRRFCSDNCRLERSRELRRKKGEKRERKTIEKLKPKITDTITQKIMELEEELKILRSNRESKRQLPEYYLNRGDILLNLSTGATCLD